MPACDAEGLAGECGRLFAIRLPAGIYEIHKAFLGNTNHPVWERPAVFSVAAGETIYLGNLYSEYCMGIPLGSRGAILGMDVSIRDRYERDSKLIRQRFPALQEAEIIRQPLPDPAWRYRVPYIPKDWGTCAPSQ